MNFTPAINALQRTLESEFPHRTHPERDRAIEAALGEPAVKDSILDAAADFLSGKKQLPPPPPPPPPPTSEHKYIALLLAIDELADHATAQHNLVFFPQNLWTTFLERHQH